jgi:hypothetical protein
MELDSLTLAQVRQGVRDALGKEGKIRSDVLPYQVAQILDARYAGPGIERFERQVMNQAAKLTRQHLIYKIGRGQPLPEGGRSAKYATYFSPEAWADAVNGLNRADELAREIAHRWDEVAIGLAKHGFHLVGRKLSLGDFERLLRDWPEGH